MQINSRGRSLNDLPDGGFVPDQDKCRAHQRSIASRPSAGLPLEQLVAGCAR